jgi:tetratricopeptide (TPR) repeat protein
VTVAEAERLKQRGNVKYNGEEYITAIKLYTRAIKLVPANPTYLLNRAAALIMMERYDDGEFVFFHPVTNGPISSTD